MSEILDTGVRDVLDSVGLGPCSACGDSCRSSTGLLQSPHFLCSYVVCLCVGVGVVDEVI